jgi:hypothetical protein
VGPSVDPIIDLINQENATMNTPNTKKPSVPRGLVPDGCQTGRRNLWTCGAMFCMAGILAGLAACQDTPTDAPVTISPAEPAFAASGGPPWARDTGGPTIYYANVSGSCALVGGNAVGAAPVAGGNGLCTVEFPVAIAECSGTGSPAKFAGAAGNSRRAIFLDFAPSLGGEGNDGPNHLFVVASDLLTGSPEATAFSVLLVCP